MSPSLKFSQVCPLFTKRTKPSTVVLPIPIPWHISSLITWTFIKLVVPLTPVGTPVVITTNSPSCIYPSFLLASIELSIRSSVFSAC